MKRGRNLEEPLVLSPRAKRRLDLITKDAGKRADLAVPRCRCFCNTPTDGSTSNMEQR
jgi:hypothetical protein